MAKPASTTAERGYGAGHQRKRREYKAVVQNGNGYCWRCGAWIPPDGDWHVGHDDQDRSITRGIECVPCNLSAAGRKRQRMPAKATRASIIPRRRACPICGATFRASYREQVTCSRACGVELRRRNAPAKPQPIAPLKYERRCSECDQAFTTRYPTQVVCSTRCRTTRTRRMMREHYHNSPVYRQNTRDRGRASRELTRSRQW